MILLHVVTLLALTVASVIGAEGGPAPVPVPPRTNQQGASGITPLAPLPPGAVAYEESKEINSGGVVVALKTSGFRIQLADKTILVGPVKIEYNNSVPYLKGQYDNNGLKTGTWTHYYPNGTVSKLTEYLEDKPNGISAIFSEDGKILQAIKVKNGIEAGRLTAD